ncbi:hypothetical protein M7I_5000 [Glarea lozoyensis 74030]|uniref:Uncharacterized protein n=1 Tax=Glarea lozoyensis (strain ATCC 74030 / MF5533) TaxID=1104152 RepID=H0EQP6_GLAL7|nr:hypothetical protein M7I_5000 [Glarea lozoyensis 74030]
MRRHIDAAGFGHQHLRSKSYANLMTEEGDPIEDYSLVFRELFCLATADLAIHLERDIDDMGILYEEITATGHLSSGTRKIDKAKAMVAKGRQPIDPERGTINTAGAAVENVGKGQLLFLVSRADKTEAADLQAAGFRFAPKEMVLPMLSACLQIDDREISRRIDLLIDYIGDSHILSPGVHVSCFAIRASIGAGFDVLARRDARNLLPTMQVPELRTLEPWQLDYLKSMELLSVAATMKLFNKDSKPKNPNAEQREFAKAMLTTLEAIKDEIDDPFFNDAQLIAQPIEAPCKGDSDHGSTGVALLITYKIIVPIHARAPGKKLDFVPLNLFRTQQRVYPNSPDHIHLARETFREFSKVLDMTGFDEDSHMRAAPSKSKFSFRKMATRKKSAEAQVGEPIDKDGRGVSQSGSGHLKPPGSSKIKFWEKGHRKGLDNSSQEGLIGPEDESADSEFPTSSNENGIEMKKLSSEHIEKKAGPSKDEGEKRTYIDEMFAITIKTKEGARWASLTV